MRLVQAVFEVNIFTNVCMSLHHVKSIAELKRLLDTQQGRGRNAGSRGPAVTTHGHLVTPHRRQVLRPRARVHGVRGEQGRVPVVGRQPGVGWLRLGRRHEARVDPGGSRDRARGHAIVTGPGRGPVPRVVGVRAGPGGGGGEGEILGSVGVDGGGTGAEARGPVIHWPGVHAGGHGVLVHVVSAARPSLTALGFHNFAEALIEYLIESHGVLFLATHPWDF